MALSPQYNPPADSDPRDALARRAAGLIGMADPFYFGFTFDDFTECETNWPQKNTSTSGLFRGVLNRFPGFLECDTGATAGSSPALTRGAIPGAVQASCIPGGTGGVWYWACRVAPNGSASYSTAQSTLTFRMADRLTITTTRGDLGKIAGTANWAFKADGGGGATIDSGIAATADTTAHVFEAWRVGGLTYLAIDYVPRGTPSDTFPTQPAVPQIFLSNGTDAASRTWLVDWVAFGTNSRSTS